MPAVGKLTALGLYQAVLTELDKTNSASFTVTQFNYYANSEQIKLMADLVEVFELTQVLSDYLEPFIKRQTYTILTTPPISPGQRCLLPTDYQQMLRATLTFGVLGSFGAFRQGQTFTRSARRVTAEQQAFIEEPNYYLRPTFDRTYRRVAAGYLELLSGIHSRLILSQVLFEYIKRPDEVVLLDLDVVDLTVDNSQVLQWTPRATYDLAHYITRAFMEQTGNPRLQNYLALNRPKVGQPPAPANPQQAQQATAADQSAT